MATLLVISKSEKERAARIAALIEDGKLPKPPNADHDAHKCADCGGFTILMPLCTDCAIKADQEAMKKRVTCDLCGFEASPRYPVGPKWACEECFDSHRTRVARIQWHEVLQMAESVASSDMLFAPTDNETEIGYDANCGMKPYAQWKAENIAYFPTPHRRAWVIDDLVTNYWKHGKTIIWPVRMALT